MTVLGHQVKPRVALEGEKTNKPKGTSFYSSATVPKVVYLAWYSGLPQVFVLETYTRATYKPTIYSQ
jgi:hypothetical protein